MFKKLSAAAVTVLAAAVLALTLPGSAHADIRGLEITRVGYNAFGPDAWTNRNQEFVDITNVSSRPINVHGLKIEDAWARANAATQGECNNWTITSLPGAGVSPSASPTAGADPEVWLRPRHTIRVYSGSGRPVVFGGGRIHAVYMDHRCGHYGHFWDNTGDTVHLTLRGETEQFTYDFRRGYYIR